MRIETQKMSSKDTLSSYASSLNSPGVFIEEMDSDESEDSNDGEFAAGGSSSSRSSSSRSEGQGRSSSRRSERQGRSSSRRIASERDEPNVIAVIEEPDETGDDAVDGGHPHKSNKTFNRILRGSIKKRLTYFESIYKSYR